MEGRKAIVAACPEPLVLTCAHPIEIQMCAAETQSGNAVEGPLWVDCVEKLPDDQSGVDFAQQ